MPHLTWVISAVAVGGVIVRPFGLAEWIFAVAGAIGLVVLGLLPLAGAWKGVAAGFDVYLFLAGMMVLAEIARREGLFDTLAAHAARAAKGSPQRLFLLVYAVGTLVTIFLSNDATAVVLTPAVAAVARTAGARTPIPYLLICAFVANAASFVLPISNPANLVVFGSDMPHLFDWLARFSLPSILAIGVTYAMLRFTQRGDLTGNLASDVAAPSLSKGGKVAAFGIVAAAIVLVGASALGADLGWPTALAGVGTLVAVTIAERSNPFSTIRSVSWDTLLLVAGLFVIVEALAATGLTQWLVGEVETLSRFGENAAAAGLGTAVAFASNATNNLPLGLVAGQVFSAADVPRATIDAALIGIDLGPNLSVTGSLATILWLTALKREGIDFGALQFLKIGILVMPAALVAALAARMLVP